MEAVVFAGVNALETNDIRNSVLRIPEVSGRIRQAQKIIEENSTVQVDLSNYLAAGDESFVSSLATRSLITAVVQIGLFERFLRYHAEPSLYIGASNGESALNYVCQKCSFEELVMNSQLVSGANQAAKPQKSNVEALPISDTQLAGAALTEYTYLIKDDSGKFKASGLIDMELTRLISQVIEQRNLQSIVNLGPGGVLMAPYFRSKLEDVRVLESLELDPMLSSVIAPLDKVAWA